LEAPAEIHDLDRLFGEEKDANGCQSCEIEYRDIVTTGRGINSYERRRQLESKYSPKSAVGE
jgi:hypothetical protein